MYKRTEQTNKVAHSSAMCLHKGETFLTFYVCPNEGWQQQVVVLRKVKDGWEKILTLPQGTGNPVLISIKDNLYLAYSMFKPGTEEIKNVPFLWKNVDMFVAVIGQVYNNGSGTNIEYPHWKYKNVAYFQNLCPRISALEFRGHNSALLPVYDETFGSGYVITFHVSNHQGTRDNYTIGRHSMMYTQHISLIQPSLYLYTGSMHFEARNFGARGNVFGIGGTWNSESRNWSVGKRDDLTNYRESVLLFTKSDVLYRVYGDKPNRTELSIGKVNNNGIKKLNELQHGCYPNYLNNEDDTFTICFTEYNSRLSERTQITLITMNDKLETINKEQV